MENRTTEKNQALNHWKGKLRLSDKIAKILGKEGLHDLGLGIPIGGKITAQWDIMQTGIEEDLLSTSDVARVDDMELQEITRNAVRSMENLIA